MQSGYEHRPKEGRSGVVCNEGQTLRSTSHRMHIMWGMKGTHYRRIKLMCVSFFPHHSPIASFRNSAPDSMKEEGFKPIFGEGILCPSERPFPFCPQWETTTLLWGMLSPCGPELSSKTDPGCGQPVPRLGPLRAELSPARKSRAEGMLIVGEERERASALLSLFSPLITNFLLH